MHSEITRKRFPTRDYYKMAEVGILGANDRVELIDGQVVEMSPKGPRHAATVYAFDSVLKNALGIRAMVRVQLPVHIDEFNEPEPDIAVVVPRDDRYVGAHPTPDEVILVVEVSESTLAFDCGVKAPLYAIAGIKEYWIADRTTDQIRIFRNPEGDGYRTVEAVGPGGTVTIQAFGKVALRVSDLLP